MAVSFGLPAELERSLREQFGDLEQAAKEALLVEAYRRGRLSHHELSQALGCDRLETEEVLHRHQVTEDLGTVEQYLADARALEELRTPKR
jgi:predicted HTH domain antitoxin